MNMYIRLTPLLSSHFTTVIENNISSSLEATISLAICSKRESDMTRNYFKIIKHQQFIS